MIEFRKVAPGGEESGVLMHYRLTPSTVPPDLLEALAALAENLMQHTPAAAIRFETLSYLLIVKETDE